MDSQHRSRLNTNMNNWYTENFLFMRYNQKDLLIKYSSTEELTPRPFKKGDTPRTSLFLHSYKDMVVFFAGKNKQIMKTRGKVLCSSMLLKNSISAIKLRTCDMCPFAA